MWSSSPPQAPLANSYLQLSFLGITVSTTLEVGPVVALDCNVTGSNYGTASKPKFPLMELWTTVLLPELDALVKPGDPCEGAVVVHQEDNAGPHIDKTYKAWLQEQFDKRGWKLEHQAPQGPYTSTPTCWISKRFQQ